MSWKDISKRTASPWVKEELVGDLLSAQAFGTAALAAGSHTGTKAKEAEST